MDEPAHLLVIPPATHAYLSLPNMLYRVAIYYAPLVYGHTDARVVKSPSK